MTANDQVLHGARVEGHRYLQLVTINIFDDEAVLCSIGGIRAIDIAAPNNCEAALS